MLDAQNLRWRKSSWAGLTHGELGQLIGIQDGVDPGGAGVCPWGHEAGELGQLGQLGHETGTHDGEEPGGAGVCPGGHAGAVLQPPFDVIVSVDVTGGLGGGHVTGVPGTHDGEEPGGPGT